MIAMYDLNDNILTVFENYKECAKYFNTSLNTLYSAISRMKTGEVKKKRDKKNKIWVKLYRMEDLDG